ncbi:MAG: porin family protein [Deltaproteobacteria bacterium]|nr:porin family protein [Deltaproteobacteria bacterium]
MKRVLSMIGMLLVCVAVTSHAQEMRSRAGAHGAYSVGGDIEESKAGFGAQAELAVNSNFSIELALSRFSDEYNEAGISLEQDLTTIGVSAVYRAALGENVHGYLIGGLDYNIVDMDASIDPAVYGISMNADVDVDNEVGFHVGAGLNFPLQNNWELFAEYRYTFLELEGDISVSAMGITESRSLEGDYDFGLLKVGVNYLF